jgi:hypothetical protein
LTPTAMGGTVRVTHRKGGHMAKLKSARDLVDAIEKERLRQKISRYALANLVAGKRGSNPINIDRRIARLVGPLTGSVDLAFALELCDHIGLNVTVQKDKK